MKTMITVKLCLALFLTIVSNDAKPFEISEVLNEIAENNEIIDGIFKPSLNGSLGFGRFGVTYKGKFLPRDNITVAMKFSPVANIDKSNQEYRMYTYLGAVNNNQSTEAYGIPSIYYYGIWNNHTMLAMTLLNCTFLDQFEAGTLTESNLLIVYREFVRVMKYIHSQGIIHCDSKIYNTAMQNGKGFIFDFGVSVDIMEIDGELRSLLTRSDFKFFSRSVFDYLGLRSNWRRFGFLDYDEFRTEYGYFIANLREDARSNKMILTGLGKILVAFDTFSIKDANGTLIPFYDQLYEVVVEELKNYGEEASSSDSFISTIPDPFGINQWTRPTVDYGLFEREYAELKKKHGEASESIFRRFANLWRR